MTRRWKIGAVLLGTFGLGMMTTATRQVRAGSPAAVNAVAAAPAHMARTAQTTAQAPVRMTAHDMAQTIGGDWFTELVQAAGSAIAGYGLTSPVQWFCGLVSCG